MKKIIFCLVCMLFGVSAFSQMSVNPQHRFYKDVQAWENRGIISAIPPLRPYSVPSIKKILNQVMENGSENDKLKVESYQKELESRPIHIKLDVNDTLKLYDEKIDNLLNVVPSLYGDALLLEDKMSLGYELGIVARTVRNEDSFIPFYSSSKYDAKFDPAEVGPFSGFLNINNSIAYNFNNFIFQTGILKSGYGDFLGEGVAMNDSAFHKPVFSISYINDYIAYSQLLSVIGATTNYGSDEIGPAKFMSFHSFDITPFYWLKASFYESVVFGRRFDPAYIIPSPYMVSQAFSGYNDSIFMGLRLRIIPVKSLSIATDVFVDDLAVNELVKFNFDSKNRIAWNTGCFYTPDSSFIDKISINYLLVTPYTYTHWDFDTLDSKTFSKNTMNYQNYTNCGYTMGTNLPPNSDLIKLAFDFSPIRNFDCNFFVSLARHGNVCESLNDDEIMEYLLSKQGIFSTDGSINTHTFGTNAESTRGDGYFKTAWDKLNFLTQENIMTIFQSGISAEYSFFDEKWGKLSINFGYIFEFIHNKGVDSHMFEGGKVSYDSGLYTYEGNTSDSKKDVVNYYKNIWKSSFKDIINNYLTVGFTYRW